MDFNGQYLTYEDYKFLGGSLVIKPFNLLEFRARTEIDDRTQGRLKNLENQKLEVKICVYEIINKIYDFSKKETPSGIKSENIDGYSVTYSDIEEITKAHKKDIQNIIDTSLGECKLDDGTPYLYRG